MTGIFIVLMVQRYFFLLSSETQHVWGSTG